VGATLAALAHRHGLELVPGRMVFELRPVGPDKGTAVRALVGALKPEAVLYCGDDRGDVPAWRAVQELDSRIVGLAVGIASEELDRDSLAECDVILEDREELLSACALLLEIASARAAG
jgi:trehalose 6-phosphate phosphatase